jgi:hypothetical protein
VLPRSPQEFPSSPQELPKEPPSNPKSPQGASKWSQSTAAALPEHPKGRQRHTKSVQEHPKRSQEYPKSIRRAPQETERPPRKAPRAPQEHLKSTPRGIHSSEPPSLRASRHQNGLGGTREALTINDTIYFAESGFKSISLILIRHFRRYAADSLPLLDSLFFTVPWKAKTCLVSRIVHARTINLKLDFIVSVPPRRNPEKESLGFNFALLFHFV